MGLKRAQSVLMVAALAVATVLGVLAAPMSSSPPPPATTPTIAGANATPAATPVMAAGDLYDAILPEHRNEVASGLVKVNVALVPRTSGVRTVGVVGPVESTVHHHSAGMGSTQSPVLA